MIEIFGTELFQWDTGRSVKVTEIEADHVHFANKGDSKAVIMDIADSLAKIPDYLLQTGKQLCVYAVKNGVTIESKIFYVKNRERPENYVYEEDQRNYIYALITNAEEAIEGANQAAKAAVESANNAVNTMNAAVKDANEAVNAAVKVANTAANTANVATQNANASAGIADLAAKNANDAADHANHTAKSLMVIGSAKGNSIHLDDAIDQFFVGMRIFGNTTQNGAPTPEAPVELVSVGDGGSITVNITGDNEARSMTIATPNGLPGIPVTTGGNYVDADGQQWVCDEIDFGRGVYVQRVINKVFDGSSDEPWSTYTYATYEGYSLNAADMAVGNRQNGYCDKIPVNSSTERVLGIWLGVSNNFIYVHNATGLAANAASWRTWLSENPITIQYILATPIETPLSEAEIAAYAALRTYRGNTTVSNDAGAWMDIEYVMDAKKYIDDMIHPVARLASVSLPASKWTGSGNLYSQVVYIDGITENSQVNLTPTVSQMTIFYEKDITFITENDGGVVTIYVIGQKPTNDYVIPANIVEVRV